jgi:HD-GYP domain-containing protein (c-di-GMP phosphodiesterase class II)
LNCYLIYPPSVVTLPSRSRAVPKPAALASALSAGPATDVRLAEVLAALTYALDLTDGQRPGHTLRTAVIAMRLGAAVGLDTEMLSALYYAALLKDSGCSSNAARMAALFGSDDQSVKLSMRLVDWHDQWRTLRKAARNCGVGRSPFAAIRHFVQLVGTPSFTREIITARCERGAQIALGLGFPPETSDAIQHVDEHWCGLGHPTGLTGDAIPILSRILLLAQTLEAFWTEEGLTAAVAMVKKRRATWFDPFMVDEVVSWRRDTAWWASIADIDRIGATVLALEPGSHPFIATDERLDRIAYAFAAVIDAKTPFTYRHSTNVAGYGAAISVALGHDELISRDILRAGLLHDIGKLGVSNRILDKPSRLDAAERAVMMKHPVWTWEILERVPAFYRFALPASLHHERIDGRGYPWGLDGDALDASARVLGVADVYEAVTADRPYRTAMTITDAVAVLEKEAGSAFDREMVDVAVELALNGTLARVAEGSQDPFAALERSGTVKVRAHSDPTVGILRVA